LATNGELAMNVKRIIGILQSVIEDSGTLLGAVRKSSAFMRNRKMPFQSLLAFMLDMRKTTLQTRLNNFI